MSIMLVLTGSKRLLQVVIASGCYFSLSEFSATFLMAATTSFRSFSVRDWYTGSRRSWDDSLSAFEQSPRRYNISSPYNGLSKGK